VVHQVQQVLQEQLVEVIQVNHQAQAVLVVLQEQQEQQVMQDQVI